MWLCLAILFVVLVRERCLNKRLSGDQFEAAAEIETCRNFGPGNETHPHSSSVIVEHATLGAGVCEADNARFERHAICIVFLGVVSVSDTKD